MTRKIVFSLPLEAAHRPQIAAFAVKHRLPAGAGGQGDSVRTEAEIESATD